MKTVSDRIFELLKEKGMSQKEFAAKTGIAESTISEEEKDDAAKSDGDTADHRDRGKEDVRNIK